MTLQNQKRSFTYKNCDLAMGGISSPTNPPIILQNNLSLVCLRNIFIVFCLQIPSYYIQDILWTKLAPAGPFPGVYILHWEQIDKMQQLLFSPIFGPKNPFFLLKISPKSLFFLLQIGQFLAVILLFSPTFGAKNPDFVLKLSPSLFFLAQKVLFFL